MSDYFRPLGPDYHVRPDQSPMQALRQAAQTLGAPPSRLAANGWGGPIHSLIHNPEVRDIWIMHDQVIVRDNRGHETQTRIHLSEQWVETLAHLWRYHDRPKMPTFDEYGDFRSTLRFPDMIGGLRFQYAGRAFSAWGPSMYIRRLPDYPFTFDRLVQNGTMTRDIANTLTALVQARCPIVVSGQTGAGKTTLLGALVHAIQSHKSPLNLLIIEKSHELPTIHPAFRWEEDSDHRRQLADLAAHATQMGLEWLVLGESTGPEAYFVIKAIAQGVPVLTTLHATSAKDGVMAMARLALEKAGNGSLMPSLLTTLAQEAVFSVNLTLQKDEHGYLGRVTDIGEVISVNRDAPVMNSIWSWKPNQRGGGGRVQFNYGCRTELSNATRIRFEKAGIPFPIPEETS